MPKRYRNLNVPFELVEFFEMLAAKKDKPTKWSAVAIGALWSWFAMHKARGAVE